MEAFLVRVFPVGLGDPEVRGVVVHLRNHTSVAFSSGAELLGILTLFTAAPDDAERADIETKAQTTIQS